MYQSKSNKFCSSAQGKRLKERGDIPLAGGHPVPSAEARATLLPHLPQRSVAVARECCPSPSCTPSSASRPHHRPVGTQERPPPNRAGAGRWPAVGCGDGPTAVADDGRPAPGLADQCQRGPVLDPHRPWRVEHHPQYEGAARPHPVEQPDDGVHFCLPPRVRVPVFLLASGRLRP